MTGPDQRPAADTVQGAMLAVDVINGDYPQLSLPLAAGTGLPGLGGARVQLVPADTNATADTAGEAAQALVASHRAAALIVADRPDIVAVVGSESQRLQIPLVDAGSTADYLTELGLEWYFRSGPGDRALIQTAFALMKRQFSGLAKPRLALLTEDDPRHAAAIGVVRDLAARAGYVIAVDAKVGSDPTDVDDLARAVAAQACDAVIAFAETPSAAVVAAGVAADPKVGVPVLGLGPGFAGAGAGFSSAVLRVGAWSAELAGRTPVAKAVGDLYQARFGTAMTWEAASSFTATMVVASAIDMGGSADPAAIRASLRRLMLSGTQVIMPWNGVRFDADGQNQLAAAVVEAWDQRFRVVYPRELSIAPIAWSARNGRGSS